MPPQLLKKKRLQPLGFVFTTTAVPPDVESVAVVSEAYLDPVPEKVLAKPEEVRVPMVSNFDGGGVPVSDDLNKDEKHGQCTEFVQATVGFGTDQSCEISDINFGNGDCASPFKFVVDSMSNLLFLSQEVETEADARMHFYHDYKGTPSLFR